MVLMFVLIVNSVLLFFVGLLFVLLALPKMVWPYRKVF